MYGEYISTRALALALAQRTDDALALADEANEATRAVETRVMAAAARAVVFLDTPDAETRGEALLSVAAELGTWDGAVCAFRASPQSSAFAGLHKSSGTPARGLGSVE